MKITKSQLKQIVQEELVAEFWGRKKDVPAEIEKERESFFKKEKKLKSKIDPGKSKEIKLPSMKKTSARKSAEEKLAALKLKEAQQSIGSYGDPIQHLHKIVSTGNHRDINKIASYLATNVYRANYDQDKKGFVQTLRLAIPQLKEVQAELGQAASAYAQSLQGVSAKWEGLLGAIDQTLDDTSAAAAAAADPVGAARDGVRQAYEEHGAESEEYRSAREKLRQAKQAQA